MRWSKITALFRKMSSKKTDKNEKASPVASACTVEVSFQAFANGSESDDTLVHPTKLSDGATDERDDTREHIFFNAAACSSVLPSTSKGCADLPAVVEVNDEFARRLAIRAGKAIALPDEDEQSSNHQEIDNGGRTNDVHAENAQPATLGKEKARYNTRRTARENEVKFYVQSKKAAQASKKDYTETLDFVFPERDGGGGQVWPKRNCIRNVTSSSAADTHRTVKNPDHPDTGNDNPSPIPEPFVIPNAKDYSAYPAHYISAEKPAGPANREEAEKIARQIVQDLGPSQIPGSHFAANPQNSNAAAVKSNKNDLVNRLLAKTRNAKTAIAEKIVGVTKKKSREMDGAEGRRNQYVIHVEQVITYSEEYVNVQVLPEPESTATAATRTPESHTPSNESTDTMDGTTPATSAGIPYCNDQHCDTCGIPKAIVTWQEEMRRSADRKQEEEEYEYRREARAGARRVFAQRKKSAATYKWVSEDDEPAIVSWQEELRRSAARKQAEEDYEYRREVSAAAKRVFAQRKKSAATYKWVSDGDEPIYDEPSYEDMGVTMPGIKGRVMVRPRF